MNTNLNPQISHRKSIRLTGYDYSNTGHYFVTICANDKRYCFGEIKEGQTHLSNIGKIAERCWLEIPKHYPNVELDKFVIMPNHVHGIIIIKSTVGNRHACSLQRRQYQKLPTIVGSFKSSVARIINQTNKHIQFAWQKSFYDHIIRNEKSFNKICEYIMTNPLNWCFDVENPKNDAQKLTIQKYYNNIFDVKP